MTQHYLGAQQIADWYGLARSSVYAHMKDETFLVPDVIVGATAAARRPVRGWLESRVKAYGIYARLLDAEGERRVDARWYLPERAYPAWFCADETRYYSGKDLAAMLRVQPQSIWHRSRRGSLPVADVVVGRFGQRGEYFPGWTMDTITRWAAQEDLILHAV